MPAPKGSSKAKFDSCVDKVTKSGSADNAYAVCNSSLSKEKNVSSNPLLFFTAWDSAFGKDVSVTPTQPGAAQDGMQAAQELITQNPGINGSTLLNLLKSKGFQLIGPKPITQEADSSTASVASVRAGVKKESVRLLRSLTNFKEAAAKDDGIGATKYKVMLIREGLGNFKDAFYYTRDALQSAVAVFEGKKCYANHPTRTEEQDRPERDVREIIGHFENCALEEDDQGAFIGAECILMPDKQYEWARGLFRETVEYSKKYPDKDFVGLSINASGDATEVKMEEFLKSSSIPESAQLKLKKAQEEGIEAIRVVSIITEATSCDLVTEAGAGGRIVKMLEREKQMGHPAEKKEAAPADAPAKDADGGDKELLGKMLKKHLGDDSVSEAVHGHASEAYEAAIKAGMGAEEAAEMVGQAMKCAKMMHAAKQADDGEGKEDEAKEDAKFTPKGLVYAEGEEKKESAASMLKLRGELAALKESLRKKDLAEYVEAKLASSGLARVHTKTIRESLTACRSKTEVDNQIALFLEGYKAGGEAGSSWIVGHEKTEAVQSGVSFADCVE